MNDQLRSNMTISETAFGDAWYRTLVYSHIAALVMKEKDREAIDTIIFQGIVNGYFRKNLANYFNVVIQKFND